MDTLVDFLLRHFVVVFYHDQTTEETKYDFFSAFLLEVEDVWMLCTAGHVLNGIHNDLKKGKILKNFEIHDGLASDSRFSNGYPFPFISLLKAHLDDANGMDYGIIRLDSLTAQALHNNGKVPISEKAWGTGLPNTFDSYQMLGLPTTGFSIDKNQLVLRPMLITVERVPIEAVPTECLSEIPRFYGKLAYDHPDAARGLPNTVHGMSGGPIFGYKWNRDGGPIAYWVVAIQSGQFEQCKLTTACFLKPFCDSVKSGIAAGRDDPTS